MNVRLSMLLASLLLLPQVPGFAGGPRTIPPEIAQKMKKGKKLEKVWVAPDFDGNKGFRLGQISNETEESVGEVQDYFPTSLRKFLKNDSPYILNLAIVSLRLGTGNSSPQSARLEVEGRIVDQGGGIVSAFTAYAQESIGGTAKDSARLAVNRITFAMAKDLMESALPTEARSPAVIVPSPAQAPTPASSPAAVPAPPSLGAPAAGPAPTVQSAPQPPAGSPKPEAQPAPATLIPADLQADLKPGPALGRLWIGPAYDRARGFAIGEVRYRVKDRNDGVDQVLPEALAEIARPDAPCLLELQIVELTIRSQGRGISNVGLGVEGRLVARDGSVVAAFTTRESVTGIGDLVDDCRLATRKVVQAIAKDLR